MGVGLGSGAADWAAGVADGWGADPVNPSTSSDETSSTIRTTGNTIQRHHG